MQETALLDAEAVVGNHLRQFGKGVERQCGKIAQMSRVDADDGYAETSYPQCCAQEGTVAAETDRQLGTVGHLGLFDAVENVRRYFHKMPIELRMHGGTYAGSTELVEKARYLRQGGVLPAAAVYCYFHISR